MKYIISLTGFLLIFLVLCVIVFISCSDVETDPTNNYADLSWTAPADYDNQGVPHKVAFYDIRIADDSLFFYSKWLLCTEIVNSLTPKDPGSLETFRVTNLMSDTLIFFAIKSVDSSGNVSLISNIVWKRTPDENPPDAIGDLKVK